MLTHPTVRFTDRVRDALDRGLPIPLIAGAADEPPEPKPEPPKPDEPKPDAPKPDDTLGEGGEKALKAERAARAEADRARKAAETRASELEAEMQKIRTSQMSDHDKAIAEAEARGRDAARAESNERLVKSEVRAVAAGKLADPLDAVRFLDLTTFPVAEDGSVDTKAIEAAIATLVEEKPYLVGETKAPRPSGDGDGGARGDTKQLTRDDLKNMKPEEIEEARVAGRLAHLLGSKT